MLMDRAAIADLIPHGLDMCMLDGLISWDSDGIKCCSDRHRNADNPLMDCGELHSACLVEFCAQAAALHGALLQHNKPGYDGAPVLYLGAVKQLQLHRPYIDKSLPTLQISAQCAVSTANGSIYQVNAVAGPELLLQGRIVLALPHVA